MNINEIILIWSIIVCIVYIVQEYSIMKTIHHKLDINILNRSIIILIPLLSYFLHIFYDHPLLVNIFYFLKILVLSVFTIFILKYRFPNISKLLKPLYIVILLSVILISFISELSIQMNYMSLSYEILISLIILYSTLILVYLLYIIYISIISVKNKSYLLYLLIYVCAFGGIFFDLLNYVQIIEGIYIFDLLLMTGLLLFSLRNFIEYNLLDNRITEFLNVSNNDTKSKNLQDINNENIISDDFNTEEKYSINEFIDKIFFKDLLDLYLTDGRLFKTNLNYYRIKSKINEYINKLEILIKKKTYELSNYKEKYKRFYDQASFIFITFDYNGKILEVNKHTIDLLKYPREYLINNNILNFIKNNKEKEKLKNILDKEMNMDYAENLDLILISRGSKEIIVNTQLANTQLVNDEENIDAIDCVMKEITSQVLLQKRNEIISNISKLAANKKEIDKLLIFYAKEIEKELDFTELNIRVLTGNPEQVFRIKKNDSEQDYSMTIHFDRPIDEDYLNAVMGNKDYTIFNRETKDKVSPILTSKDYNSGFIVVLSYGESIRAIMEILYNKNQELSHEHIDIVLKTVPILSLIFEFTDLFRKISYSENRYRNIVESSYDAIIILDEYGNIRELNNSAIKLLEWDISKHGAIIGKNINRFLTEDIHFILLKKNHKQSFRELKFITKEKNELTVDLNLIKSTTEGNILIYCVVNDITEKYNQEVQLIQASKMATLGEMSTSVAHELNQPLNNIGIIAQRFIKKVEKGEFEKDFFMNRLELLMGQIKRASKIINHMREFGRISDRDIERTIVNDPIKNIFTLISEQLKVHNVEIELNLDNNIPPIMANANRLEQILLNMINNARDAMKSKDEKKLTIRTYYDNNFVYIEISDTGVGMSEKVQRKIFEPFYTTKEIGKGTGLGLSISYNLIKDYKGDIQVKSRLNQGSSFIIKFPAVKEKSIYNKPILNKENKY